MVKAFFDPKHPRGSSYRKTPPPKGKAPCCSSCEMYLLCQFGSIELEIVRDPSFAADSIAGEIATTDTNSRQQNGGVLFHTVRIRPRLRTNTKIREIKDYQAKTGASLKDAKEHVEKKYDQEVKWVELENLCPRFGPSSIFWDEEVEMS